jgi:hypothetical protein
MISEFLTTLRGIGSAIYQGFVLPGTVCLSQLDVYAPELAQLLSYGHGRAIVTFMIALAVWTLALVALILLRRVLLDLTRIVRSVIETILFRITLELGNLKSRLVCRFRKLVPKHNKQDHESVPTIQFDDLDLAVLHSASTLGPGFALSAPELADELTMRPAQIQRSLEKLSVNKMLDAVMGSTDDFDNYRLTDSGAAFLLMLQRQNAGA